MRKNTLITLGISTAFGALAIVLARGWINDAVSVQYEQSRPAVKLAVKKIKTLPVLVADMNLQFGDTLTPQNLRIAQYLEGAVPEGSFSSFEQLFADPQHTVAVLKYMSMNEPLLAFKITAPGQRANLSTVISDNMRAVSIRVDTVSGVAGFIQPGDRVDVFFVQAVMPVAKPVKSRNFSSESTQPRGNLITTTLLQDIKILGVDQRPESPDSRIKISKTVTVEVLPKQAQKLALAMQVGSLSLSLRRAGSKDVIEPMVLTVSNLTNAAQKPQHQRISTRPRITKKRNPKPTNSVASVIVVRDGKPVKVSVFKGADKDETIGEVHAGGSL